MRRAWQAVFIIVVTCLTSSASALETKAVIPLCATDSDRDRPLTFKEEICAGRDVVEVGIPEKPLLLSCDAANFEQLYLTYCTADAYTRLTGETSQHCHGVKKELVPQAHLTDVRESRVFLSDLRREAQQQLTTEDPPAEVDFSEHFPPAMRQMTNDCGSCAMANGVTGVQARQFALWGSPWAPEEIVSPFSFSRKSDSHDCSLTMAEPFTFWRQEGAWTNDILPYGDGDCHSVDLSPEERTLGYPLHAAEYRQVIFVRDADYGTYIGTPDDVRRAIALGKNVQLAFGPLGSTDWAHTLAIMGYNQEGVLYLNSWGADWGPNGDGTGIFTWEWLLTSGPIWPPFFSSPHPIWFYFNAASDWEGECDPAHLPYDYRGVCQDAADLSVEKTGPDGSVLAGSEIVYDIKVTNAGPDPAEDIVLTDDLPAGTDVVSTNPGCLTSDGAVTCTWDALPADADVFLKIVTVAHQAGSLKNTVTVSSTTADLDPRNNTATHTTHVDAEADLAISKTVSANPVTAGQLFTFTLAVKNHGPTSAESVTAVDRLPDGLDTLSTSPGCWDSAGIVTCTLDVLPADDAASWEVVVRTSEPGHFTNTVTVSSLTPDPDTLNNSASEITRAETQADLVIVKAASADPVALEQPFSYTLTVTNRGPSAASAVVLTDTLPATVVYRGWSGDGWTCREIEDMVTCTTPYLGAGEAATVTLGVDAPAAGRTFENRAAVSSAAPDPDKSSNQCAETTALMGLLAEATVFPDPVLSGHPLTYTLWVTNAGAVDLHATVTDTLPAQVTPGGTMTWTAMIPAPRGVWSETVAVRAERAFEGSLTNIVEIVTQEGVEARRVTVSTVVPPRSRAFLPLLLRDH